MKRTLVVLAVSALFCSSVVFAAPRALSSAEMDQVTAGASIADSFIAAFTNGVGVSNPVDTTQNPSTTSGPGSPAVAGTTNTTAGAVADNGAKALNGEGNVAVDLTQNGGIAVGGSVAGENNNPNIQNGDGLNVQTGDISFNDAFKAYTNTYTSTNVGKGNASLIGDNGTINNTTDNSEVEGTVGGDGVVARTATITDSFKTTVTTNVVTTVITDSFNTVTNTLTVSGQGTVSGIITANSLGFQNIGSNMNITTATSTVPANSPAPSGASIAAGLGAASLANVTQTNVCGSIGVYVGEIEVGLPLITAGTAQ